MANKKLKAYMEDVSSLKWMSKNVPKQWESAFIRNCVSNEITRIKLTKKRFSTENLTK